jgi:hypothetical protein
LTPGRAAWWAGKVRQFRGHLWARIEPAERAALQTWLTPAQASLFDAMHVADRRHGLDVVAGLRAEGVADPEVLLAGLLHDVGKGTVGVWPRVAFSLGQAYGSWVWTVARVVPGFGTAIERLRDHAESSARLVESAGCGPRTVGLVRWQDSPRDPEFGELLRLVDEAN